MSEIRPEVKIIQPLEISETEGFEQDKLDRKGFGETLAQILENQPGGNIFALDAGWGQGKTTFIKMWRGHVGHVRENKLQTIYFDAFANDYQKDILRVLTTRILGTIGKGNFFIRRSIKRVMKLAAVIAKSRFVSSGFVLDFSSIPGWMKKTIISFWEAIPGSSILTRVIEKVAPAELRKAMQSKPISGGEEKFQEAEKLMMDFKEELGKLTKTEKSGPIIFIVDELDRCRPDFALDLLETIKHFFEVPGIVFLLVMNREALDDMIRTRYGTNDGTRYMQKFVQHWIGLPEPDTEGYAQALGLSHPLPGIIKAGKKVNLREIQSIFAYHSLLMGGFVPHSSPSEQGATNLNPNASAHDTVSLLSYLKVVAPDRIQKILDTDDSQVDNLDWSEYLNLSEIIPSNAISSPDGGEIPLRDILHGDTLKKCCKCLVNLEINLH